MKITKQKIAGHDAVRYRYEAGGCMDFDLNLLCEVGGPYQIEAEKMAADYAADIGCIVKTIEIDVKPWVIDVFYKVAK